LAKEQGIAFLETSAKTGTNVEEIFTVLTESILVRIEEGSIETRTHPGIKMGNEKYLGIREQFVGQQVEREERVVIGKGSKRKKGCCK
jgi:hypothetical protein